MVVATEFSADATLNAAKFASRAMASSITSHCLLWLCHWQADMRSKWRLGSAPFRGRNLFREALDPILVENKDRQKVLPSIHRRVDHWPLPYFHRPSFRFADTGLDAPQYQRPYFQRTVRTNLDSVTEADSHFRPSNHFGGQKIGPFTDLSDCHPRLPIGGRLSLFAIQWEKQHWILRCYRQ